ncbi:TonB-dependent receptor domain-containing protein [Flavobacterium algicola]|uniref:TonB-dependent receptor domain-containing protein n=1 Tax=Flavobacterium algicola TaxID=556529 RepID=UPI001EFE2B9D|nr:TonB-dependent receptor [Flavobacterium algicola]MCG9791764.1 TonB-dependent receptor [Flavobacterium algicola]
MRIKLLFTVLLFTTICFAQNSISGIVTGIDNQGLFGVNVKIVGDNSGTVTDSNGKFILKSNKKLPWTVEFSSVGFTNNRMTFTTNNQNATVTLDDEHTKLNEIVISASRTPERIFESPVTVERMGIREIKKTASPTFYDGLENMKEVHMNTSSLSFKSINTRGFASVANSRFLQLVDGMDNSSPLLNFVLGNMIGVSEIDVQSVELLPGASSALYGANAFNGILFMNSKNPFDHQGISSYFKYGQTSQKAAGVNDFYDFGIRMAHAFDKHFAAKFNFTYMEGTDWYATNYDDKTVDGRTRSHQNYDGINVYGDEATINIYDVGQSLVAGNLLSAGAASTLPNENVSRTGYNETDLTDNKAGNTKVDFSLHFRPLGTDKLEVIWQSKFGFGNAVYQGANRYYLNNFSMQQHKLEIKGDNFFIRGYTTTEDGGESYDMLFTGLNVNKKWKSDAQWFGQYAGAYAQAINGAVPNVAAGNSTTAHAFARGIADTGRFLPGTAAFNNAFNQVIAEADVTTGSKLVDNSKIYHGDANYNFKEKIKFAEVQVGGSYRSYELNSHGRIYTDADAPIKYNEYGMYSQVTKKFMEDRLKFTGSARYDKSKNFDGNVSPRLSLVYSGGESRNHNFRASFQTGFRNPTTQDQYIGFNVGSKILIGSAPDNLAKVSEILPVANSSGLGQFYAGGTTVVMTGENAYNNSYTLASVTAFEDAIRIAAPTTPQALVAAQMAAAPLLTVTKANLVRPEEVKAFEIGYRSQVDKIYVDANAYYNVYNNFIGGLDVKAPLYGTVSETVNFAGALTASADDTYKSIFAITNRQNRAYQLYTNSEAQISSFGFGLGLSRKVFQNFDATINYNFAEFKFDQADNSGFEAGFNTPKHRVKLAIGNDKLFKNFGFNISGRWNSSYLWESSMVDGMIASATVIDAQVNYSIPSIKSVLKIGAANLGGKEYTQVLGAGAIGQQIFASFTINP